eukprot:Plantae.Rhodophyta-Hildenbrandia_rubra.ctg27497.p1 GENE.Plantae.Rhodophyta-Hildenbrandia_rubra.ctg27497~~Plantae.Rhodophyta-Hildenbrandia_rubra.ctg27497.p1  ORF type:complete len:262 (+),score=78.77 Plantae.Rhodophyta-Hildenbrandia_rubra.ctg27497:87-872(+)
MSEQQATKDFYGILGVERTATSGEIKRAYHRLALTVHPDKQQASSSTSNDATEFQQLQKVYEILRDPEQRAIYDEYGEKGLDGFEGDIGAMFDFWKQRIRRVTKEEIELYEKSYRGGEEERVDLKEFYGKFEGDVGKVLDYIPYSRDEDLDRFVRIWDEMITSKDLEGNEVYKKCRKTLLKKAKDVGKQLKEKGKRKGNAKKKEKLGGGDDGIDSLAAAILQRRGGREAAFDSWADSLASKYETKPKKTIMKRKGKKKKTS